MTAENPTGGSEREAAELKKKAMLDLMLPFIQSTVSEHLIFPFLDPATQANEHKASLAVRRIKADAEDVFISAILKGDFTPVQEALKRAESEDVFRPPKPVDKVVKAIWRSILERYRALMLNVSMKVEFAWQDQKTFMMTKGFQVKVSVSYDMGNRRFLINKIEPVALALVHEEGSIPEANTRELGEEDRELLNMDFDFAVGKPLKSLDRILVRPVDDGAN
jgi:hypothetical protein